MTGCNKKEISAPLIFCHMLPIKLWMSCDFPSAGAAPLHVALGRTPSGKPTAEWVFSFRVQSKKCVTWESIKKLTLSSADLNSSPL